ncbi:MAG: hypothetical protein HY665_07025 [Chloroflexi bacterium]|nr:hypothetical protein [Chloroflexota bacterium]
MTIDYGYITGWVAAVVLMFVLPLLVTFISYLWTINHQLSDIKDILARAFPAETQKSKQDYSRYSYLEKLFIRRRDRETRKDNLIHGEHDETDKVSHRASIP